MCSISEDKILLSFKAYSHQAIERVGVDLAWKGYIDF